MEEETWDKHLPAAFLGTEQMFILEKSPEKAKELEGQNLGTVYGEPGDYVQQSDLIILAVKPQDFPVLATAIRNYIDKQQVVLSIMAGVKMAAIHDLLGTAKWYGPCPIFQHKRAVA